MKLLKKMFGSKKESNGSIEDVAQDAQKDSQKSGESTPVEDENSEISSDEHSSEETANNESSTSDDEEKITELEESIAVLAQNAQKDPQQTEESTTVKDENADHTQKGKNAEDTEKGEISSEEPSSEEVTDSGSDASSEIPTDESSPGEQKPTENASDIPESEQPAKEGDVISEEPTALPEDEEYEYVYEEDKTEEQKMIEAWKQIREPLKLPLPLPYPHYLRQPPTIPLYTNRAAEVRKNSIAEKTKENERKRAGEEEPFKKKTEIISIEPRYNRAFEYRKKHTQKELIPTGHFVNHYKQFCKPPFLTKVGRIRYKERDAPSQKEKVEAN